MNNIITKSESQNIEFKTSWKDEYLKWICGFADACVEAGLRWPHFRERSGGLLVELTKSSEKSSEKILRLLQESPSLSARKIAEKLSLSSRAVEKQIKNLKNDNKIKRIGSPKGGYWKVIDD